MVEAIEKTAPRTAQNIAQNIAQKRAEKHFTLREYLDRELRSVNKHEFHNGKIVAMPGGKAKHSEIATNFSHAIKLVIKPLPIRFRVYNSDLKIYIESADKAVYPDALVVCEQPDYWQDREDLIVNPLLIVEILSKSTRKYDRGDKFMLYQTLPSFKEYVLVEQKMPHVEAWFRERPNTWDKLVEDQISASIVLRSLGVSIPLSDIYENIEF